MARILQFHAHLDMKFLDRASIEMQSGLHPRIVPKDRSRMDLLITPKRAKVLAAEQFADQRPRARLVCVAHRRRAGSGLSMSMNAGIVATGGVCVFGRWSGTIRVEDQDIAVDGLIGSGDEFAHRS